MSESQVKQVLEENIEKEVEEKLDYIDKLVIEAVEIQKTKEDQEDKKVQVDLHILEEKLDSLRVKEENQKEEIIKIDDEIRAEEIRANQKDNPLLEESHIVHKDETQIINTIEQNDTLNNTTTTKFSIEEKSKFYDNLRTVIKTQENILH